MKCALAALVFAMSAATSAFGSTQLLVNTSPTEATCAANSVNKGYFPASSFSFGGSAPTMVVSGSGGSGAGKISLQNLIIGKSFDNCSGILITQFLTEANIPTLTLLETESIGGAPAPTTILRITLTNARITSYSLSAGGGANDIESISFGYSKACIASTSMPTENPGKPVTTTTCYNAATNTVTD